MLILICIGMYPDFANVFYVSFLQNTLGSYNCIRFIPCGTGYTFNTLSGRYLVLRNLRVLYAKLIKLMHYRCEDDDECALGLHNCNSLGPAYYCRNTQGQSDNGYGIS